MSASTQRMRSAKQHNFHRRSSNARLVMPAFQRCARSKSHALFL
jgi:hypothetical protein